MITTEQTRALYQQAWAEAPDGALMHYFAQLVASHARDQAESASLDFMVRRSAVVQWYGETCQLHGDQGVISGEGEFYDSAREAIDAAMALEAK